MESDMDRTVVITGANRGIGLELVHNYVQSGAHVIAGVRDPSAAIELRNLALEFPIRILELDVANGTSVSNFCRAIGDEKIDGLINNAGILGGDRQSISDMDYEAWSETIEVNTIAPFRLSIALLDNLKRAKAPRIVTLTSQMGALSRRRLGSFAYSSSKAAANKMMQVLALELEAYGIIACPVHPGWVRTEMGGPAAALSVEESAKGLFALIEGLTLEQSGRFWTWDGTEHGW